MISGLNANPLRKRAKKGFRGYPVGTIAYYGPDDTRASKVAVGIVMGEGEDPEFMEKWFSDSSDLRRDKSTIFEISDYLKAHDVLSVVVADRIIGCPHEEGIDYPEGEACPKCPFWKGRDRFTGEPIP